jgi:uncharacterized protein YkwD
MRYMRLGKGPRLARWLGVGVLSVGVLLFANPSAALPRAADSLLMQPDGSAARADELGELINRARVADGLLPLARSPELDAAARVHSRDMAERDYLDHGAPDGSTPRDRARRAGYVVPPDSGWIVVELISAISDEPRGPLRWWLEESPEQHGKVLRNPRWREMGVGYAQGGRYGNYWTVLVGCRPGVIPQVVLGGVTYRHEERCDQRPLSEVPGVPPTATSVPPSPAPLLAPDLRVSPSRVGPGGAVTATWSGIPSPRGTDWLGLRRVGETEGVYLTWLYVSCAQVPAAARPGGACSFPAPASPDQGRYELHLLSGDTRQVLARSEAFTVSASFTPTVIQSPAPASSPLPAPGLP